jgi:nitric oxide dioxygenase
LLQGHILAVVLSEKNIEIITTTSKMVVTHASEITKQMYKIMFAKYPDIKELFKNQPENQYMILAEALSLFTVNIDKIEKLTPALETIARKHVQCNVKRGHYPVVGSSLLLAMEDVLKEKATLEFIDAWTQAYKYLSEILLEMEDKMYEKLENK